MDVDKDSINWAQIEKMKHCIGFSRDRVKRGKYEAYRNRYITPDIDDSWEWLVIQGIADRDRTYPEGSETSHQLYFLTKKGLDLLEHLLEIKITEMD